MVLLLFFSFENFYLANCSKRKRNELDTQQVNFRMKTYELRKQNVQETSDRQQKRKFYEF